MKKLALTIAVVAGASLVAYSQGQINIGNGAAQGYVVESSAGHTTANASGTYVVSSAFTCQLFALSPTTETLPSGVDAYGYLAPSLLVSDGYVAAGGTVAGAAGDTPDTTVAVPGTAGANTIVAVVCWTGGYSTFASALTAWNSGLNYMGIISFDQAIGWTAPSPIVTDISSGWNTLANSPRNAAFGGIAGSTGDLIMTIAPVPEPSSLALAGLGGFGMLMAFRRKKA